jgi:hypothetical protein
MDFGILKKKLTMVTTWVVVHPRCLLPPNGMTTCHTRLITFLHGMSPTIVLEHYYVYE